MALARTGLTRAFVPSVSLESSAAEPQEEMLQVLKEKMRLEGQLEALSLEASQVMDALDVLTCGEVGKHVWLLCWVRGFTDGNWLPQRVWQPSVLHLYVFCLLSALERGVSFLPHHAWVHFSLHLTRIFPRC